MATRFVTIVVQIPEHIAGDEDSSQYVIETVSDLLTPFGDPLDATEENYYFVTENDLVKAKIGPIPPPN